MFERLATFVALTGEERRPYLHSLTTNRIDDLEPGQARRAFMLTPTQGRIVADFLACETGEELWLECADGSGAAVMELLQKYYFGQEVAFEDRSQVWRLLSLQGPQAASMLERLQAPVPAGDPGAHAAGAIEGARARVVRWSDTGEAGFHLWVPADEAGAVRSALVAAGAEAGEDEAWKVLQIEAGIAAFGRELTDETIPLEAPTEEAIRHDKGCYPGQEVIARLHVRGRPARLLRGLRIEGEQPLRPGAVLDAPDKPRVARVTASGVSPALGPIALAYVHRDFVEAGMRLSTGDGRAAEVADLPMIPAHV